MGGYRHVSAKDKKYFIVRVGTHYQSHLSFDKVLPKKGLKLEIQINIE